MQVGCIFQVDNAFVQQKDLQVCTVMNHVNHWQARVPACALQVETDEAAQCR